MSINAILAANPRFNAKTLCSNQCIFLEQANEFLLRIRASTVKSESLLDGWAKVQTFFQEISGDYYDFSCSGDMKDTEEKLLEENALKTVEIMKDIFSKISLILL
ncbi:MAG: hypothetical protein K1060chlam1_00437 [Candidatus Anoxychlamydiales bacterium]|nr:hypothetical protein [Candidatus Anoxychlamydiales bacterium]